MEKMDMKLIRTNQVRLAKSRTKKTIGSINSEISGAIVELTYKFGCQILKRRTYELKKDSNIGLDSDCPINNCDGDNYIFNDFIEKAVKTGCVLSETIQCNGNTDPDNHHPTAKCQGNVDIKVTPLRLESNSCD